MTADDPDSDHPDAPSDCDAPQRRQTRTGEVDKGNHKCKVPGMGRPSRTPDRLLAEQVRTFMHDHVLDGSDLAVLLKVDPATVSRSLSKEAFSPAMREKITTLIIPQAAKAKLPQLLQKSLHLFAISDRLREQAEAMVRQAIDLAHQPK